MAINSFRKNADLVRDKRLIAVIACVVAFALLVCGCVAPAQPAATEDPLTYLYGTYYGYNGSVLILKADGEADYFYTGQNDVKHDNSWSLEGDEIKIKLSWMFCTVKGTLESDPISFVLVGNSDLDDILWDDERFVKVSDNTLAMTKAECEEFISNQQNTVVESTSEESEITAVSDSEVILEEYTSSFDVDSLSVEFVDVGTISLPVPSDMVLVNTYFNAGAEAYTYTADTKGFLIGYVPVGYVLGEEGFDSAGESFISSFAEGLGNTTISSDELFLVGGCRAIEYTGTATVDGVVYNLKSIVIDHSTEGYVAAIVVLYHSTSMYMIDYYHYAISIMQGADPIPTGSSDASTTVETTMPTSSTTATTDYSAGAQCEYAYVVHFRNNNYPNDASLNYDMYYLFDTDTSRTYSFVSSAPSIVDVGTYTGDLSGVAWGVEVNWSYGDGSTYWQYVSGSDYSIDVSDEYGYCFYAERVSSSEAESMITIP